MGVWSWCLSFQSETNVPLDEVSLPYASYMLLYAASVTTGDCDWSQLAAVAPPALAEQALATSARRARDAGIVRPERRCIPFPFRSTDESPVSLRSPVVRSTERRRYAIACKPYGGQPPCDPVSRPTMKVSAPPAGVKPTRAVFSGAPAHLP